VKKRLFKTGKYINELNIRDEKIIIKYKKITAENYFDYLSCRLEIFFDNEINRNKEKEFKKYFLN
jgi:hypothetical protein